MARLNHPKVAEEKKHIGLSSNELFILVYCTCCFSHCFHQAIKVHAVNGKWEKEKDKNKVNKKEHGRRVHRNFFSLKRRKIDSFVYLTCIKKGDASLLNKHLECLMLV